MLAFILGHSTVIELDNLDSFAVAVAVAVLLFGITRLKLSRERIKNRLYILLSPSTVLETI